MSKLNVPHLPHPPRVHGTGIEKRAKRPAYRDASYAAADEFNEAFDKVFCKHRPWLEHVKGYKFDPFLKPKTAR